MKRMLLYLPLAIAAGGCANPSINLATRDPLKVDINVRMDVYQHGGQEVKVPEPEAEGPDVETRRRNRMGEVQSLKNSRIVGENRLGLLEQRIAPGGDYGDYTKALIASENRDREEMMRNLAKERQVSLEVIRENQARLFRELAFKGEWIEAHGDGNRKTKQTD
jgi:hypothetical protein